MDSSKSIYNVIPKTLVISFEIVIWSNNVINHHTKHMRRCKRFILIIHPSTDCSSARWLVIKPVFISPTSRLLPTLLRGHHRYISSMGPILALHLLDRWVGVLFCLAIGCNTFNFPVFLKSLGECTYIYMRSLGQSNSSIWYIMQMFNGWVGVCVFGSFFYDYKYYIFDPISVSIAIYVCICVVDVI